MSAATGFLVVPREGEQLTARVLRKSRLLGARALLTLPSRGLPPSLAGASTQLRRALKTLLGAAPEETLRALGAPEVVPWLGCVVRGSLPLDEGLRGLVPPLMVELGTTVPRPALERMGQLLWDVPVERLADPQRGGELRFDGPAAGLLLDATGVELRDRSGALHALADLPVERTLHDVGPLPGRLALRDANPLFALEAHPDKQGNAVDLGDRSVDAWTSALADALAAVEAAVPALVAEMRESLCRILPVGHDERVHMSASYVEAPGTVYLSLHPSTLTLAEALIHETQHGKLNALRWLDPLLTNDRSETVVSPIRPDPRPVEGVLLAAHAFVPVALLHQRLAEQQHPLTRNPAFDRRRAEVLATNSDALRTLHRFGRWTPQGVRVFEALQSVHDETVLAADDALLRPIRIDAAAMLTPSPPTP